MNTKTKSRRDRYCDICHSPLENEWGNNAWPIIIDGTCCDTCNGDVIMARILQMNKKTTELEQFINNTLERGSE